MGNLTAEVLCQAWYEPFQQYVDSHQDSMLYHSLKYRALITELLAVEDHYLLAIDENKAIRGILPMMYKDGALGKVVNSLPYYGSNGAVLASDQRAFDFLLAQYNAMVQSAAVAAATLITNPLLVGDDYAEIKHSFTDYRIGQFTCLDYADNHAEQLMASFHYKTRNMVRKAQKEEVRVEVDNDNLGFLADVHKENMAAIGGKAKSDRFFELLPQHYAKGTDYKIYLGWCGSEPICAMLLFYHNTVVEYYTPVIKAEYRTKQPLSLLVFQAMTDAAKAGYKRWNWGGTWASQEGVYRFKKRWGSEDTKYYYYTQLNNQKMLSCTQEELSSAYDDFFVLPFNQLEAAKTAS